MIVVDVVDSNFGRFEPRQPASLHRAENCFYLLFVHSRHASSNACPTYLRMSTPDLHTSELLLQLLSIQNSENVCMYTVLV